VRLAVAGVVLAAVLWLCHAPVLGWAQDWHAASDLAALVVLALIGTFVYAGTVMVLFRSEWLALFRGR
jgi:hypothetical protein